MALAGITGVARREMARGQTTKGIMASSLLTSVWFQESSTRVEAFGIPLDSECSRILLFICVTIYFEGRRSNTQRGILERVTEPDILQESPVSVSTRTFPPH